MVRLTLRSLIGKLNSTSRKTLEAAAGLCLSRTHYDVDLEHVLVKLIELDDGDVPLMLRHFEADRTRLVVGLTRALDRFKTGNARTPGLSPRIVELTQDAWLLASIEFNQSLIRSGVLLLSMMQDEQRSRVLCEASPEFSKIPREILADQFLAMIAESKEEMQEAIAPLAKTGSGIAGVSADRYDIFISYRREQGAAEARALRSALTERGVRSFLDVDDLRAGKFDAALLRRIEETPNFVLVLTPGCLAGCKNPRDWLRQEIARAVKSARNIVPVRVAGFQFPAARSLPVPLRVLLAQQSVDYSHEYFDAAVARLFNYLIDLPQKNPPNP
jgi:hypothetical protein